MLGRVIGGEMDGWVLGGGCVVLDDVRMGCCAVVLLCRS